MKQAIFIDHVNPEIIKLCTLKRKLAQLQFDSLNCFGEDSDDSRMWNILNELRSLVFDTELKIKDTALFIKESSVENDYDEAMDAVRDRVELLLRDKKDECDQIQMQVFTESEFKEGEMFFLLTLWVRKRGVSDVSEQKPVNDILNEIRDLGFDEPDITFQKNGKSMRCGWVVNTENLLEYNSVKSQEEGNISPSVETP